MGRFLNRARRSDLTLVKQSKSIGRNKKISIEKLFQSVAQLIYDNLQQIKFRQNHAAQGKYLVLLFQKMCSFANLRRQEQRKWWWSWSNTSGWCLFWSCHPQTFSDTPDVKLFQPQTVKQILVTTNVIALTEGPVVLFHWTNQLGQTLIDFVANS